MLLPRSSFPALACACAALFSCSLLAPGPRWLTCQGVSHGGIGHCGHSAKISPDNSQFSQAALDFWLLKHSTTNLSTCGHRLQCMMHCSACCPDPDTIQTCHEHCDLCHRELPGKPPLPPRGPRVPHGRFARERELASVEGSFFVEAGTDGNVTLLTGDEKLAKCGNYEICEAHCHSCCGVTPEMTERCLLHCHTNCHWDPSESNTVLTPQLLARFRQIASSSSRRDDGP